MFLKSSRIPAAIKNKYVLSSIAFIVWMLFFDQNNVIIQSGRIQHLKHSTTQKHWYEAEIETLDADRNALLSDAQTLEKFARENYMMKRPDEDVYIILE